METQESRVNAECAPYFYILIYCAPFVSDFNGLSKAIAAKNWFSTFSEDVVPCACQGTQLRVS